MRNSSFYSLLLLLIVLDGWLLSHPNLIGQAGVFFFDYDAIKTFPRAVGTVSLLIGASLLISIGISRLSRPVAIGITVAMLAASAYYLMQSFTQYNSGIYKLTGAGFRAGAILLPGLLVVVFGKGFSNLILSKRVR